VGRALGSKLHFPCPASHLRHDPAASECQPQDRTAPTWAREHLADDGHLLPCHAGHERRCRRRPSSSLLVGEITDAVASDSEQGARGRFGGLLPSAATTRAYITGFRIGSYGVDPPELALPETVFLFQANGVYRGSEVPNVICLMPETIERFMRDHLQVMPQSVQRWFRHLERDDP
jgi:hypothetical protein